MKEKALNSCNGQHILHSLEETLLATKFRSNEHALLQKINYTIAIKEHSKLEHKHTNKTEELINTVQVGGFLSVVDLLYKKNITIEWHRVY